MRALTSPELTKIRAHGQFCRFGMVIPTPATVTAGTIESVPDSNDSVVQIGWAETSGAYANVKPGMTCWIGSSAGAYDVGVVRIRKAPTSSIMYISETSEIDWTFAFYVTVVQEFAIWRKDMRVVGEDTFYMDYEVLYTNQHSVPAPVVNMGIDAVIDVTLADVVVNFDASGSYTIDYGALTYSWACTPAPFASSGLLTATPTFTIRTYGTYMISCTVSSGGASHTGYRFIHAYNATHPPTTDFSLNQFEGRFDSGGWSAEVTLYDAQSIPDRARVVLFSRDWYQGVEGAIGFVSNRSNIAFIGWVIGKTVKIDPVTNTTTFRVAGPQAWLKMIKSYTAGVEDTDFADNGGGDPNRWSEMKNLTPTKGLWTFLHWRTTATNCIDIFLPPTVRVIAQTKAAIGTLWDQLVAMSTQVDLSFPVCDKFGRLHVLPHQQYMSLTDRGAIPIIMDITVADCSEIEITPRIIPGLYYAEVTGVYYDGSYYGEEQFIPMGAIAPGSVPRFMGEGELIFAEIAMGTQGEAIEKAGLVLGSEAGEPAMVTLTLEELIRVFDIAEHSYFTLTIDVADGVDYPAQYIVPRSVRFDWDPEIGFHSTSLEGVGYGLQLPAIAKTYINEGEPPIIPPPEPDDDPPPPPWERPPPPEEVPEADAVVSISDDVRTSDDFDQATPTWTSEI